MLLTTVAAGVLALSFGFSGPAVADPAHQHISELGSHDAPVDIVRKATDLPASIGDRGPETVRVRLETVEVTGRLADDTSYHYWTFNRKVPGPLVRVRVGDTIEVLLENHADNMAMHNVDFHAVTGLHGGGHATLAAPGEEKGFTFKALKPGLYVYHCAVGPAAQHIANGMYGMVLVEPEGGLPPVDHEFYVMQGEIYTEEAFGTPGELTESYDKLMDEQPEYYVLNGAAEGLTGDNAMKAKVGETVRIYFGVGGPNKTSSFHVIGEIFDKVYDLGSLTGEVRADVQTISVPPGGAAVVDFKVEVPGEYLLVDHALSRVGRGLVAKLIVDGPQQPEIYREGVDQMLGLLTQ
ncbi:MAG: copper-containing nitrite reductase [Aurantimonas endophytica]|uniref:copper-containing nitrite reductase n=1 Tax=Aurantimonas endophytica TaxID=1522175 RepID=UPI0030036F84